MKEIEGVKIKTSWDEITYGEFEQIEQIRKADIPTNYLMLNIISILSGESQSQLQIKPARVYNAIVNSISFIYEEPKANKIQKTYTINGTKYTCKADISNVTTAQYIDYQTFMKETPRSINKLLGVWLIPEGKEYNEGYDIQDVWKDIDDLCILDVMAISFFLLKQSVASTLILKDFLKKNLKKMKVKNSEIMDKVEIPLVNMAYSQWCLGFAKKPSPRSIKFSPGRFLKRFI